MARAPDLDSMSLEDLTTLRDSIEERRSRLIVQAREDLITETRKRAEQLGLDIEGLFAPPKIEARSRSSPAPKYRGPNGELWSGRGRVPIWLRTIEAEGGDREKYKIE